jgi:EAL domain-containing protein (putative c-di-GMP-specific phosphodiesterase class I)
MQVTLDDKMQLENDLYKAVQEEQFVMYYQVQVNEQGQPFGAEALLRWIHPERGIISPKEFITVAEDTGLILPIGQWVINQACAQLARWQKNKITADLRLSINVSVKQFNHSKLVSNIHHAVMHHRIRPYLLTLELTESIMLDNIESIVTKIHALRALGIRFALDDFGSGYSSLQYIKRLPLDQLKIDSTFVRDLTAPGNDWIITRTIIGMAKSMGFDVIAEGVETVEQKNILLVQGGTKFQGFLFGSPLPIQKFEDHLTLMYHTLREGDFNAIFSHRFEDGEINIRS